MSVGISFEVLASLSVIMGLLGFIEPCTIGAHLIFLNSLKNKGPVQQIKALTIFTFARAMVVGTVGGAAAWLGQPVIALQTGLWVAFGSLYVLIGVIFLTGATGYLRFKVLPLPTSWQTARNPLALGLVFGLNIPACSAPILFAVLSLAATAESATLGFASMFLFGLFLTLPLAVFLIFPALAENLPGHTLSSRTMRIMAGIIFIVLGSWSMWFGIYFDPAPWSSLP